MSRLQLLAIAPLSILLLSVSFVEAAGPNWRTDFEAASAEATQDQKPLLLHFHAVWCGPCRTMEREFLHATDVVKHLSGEFVLVKIDADKYPELLDRFKVVSLPTDLYVDPSGRILGRNEGYQQRSSYLAKARRVRSDFDRSHQIRVARNETEATIPSTNLEKSLTSQEEKTPGQQSASPSTGPATQNSEEPVAVVNLNAGSEVLGMEGYSPVALQENRKWLKGRPEITATYQGVVYYFQTEAEKQAFDADPRKFAPRLLGCDPVILTETDRAVPGSTSYGAYLDNELFLFSSISTRERFKKAPYRYTRTRHVLKVDQIDQTALR